MYEDKEGRLTMRVPGRNMAYMLKCMDAGKRAGVSMPKLEEPNFTNFIR